MTLCESVFCELTLTSSVYSFPVICGMVSKLYTLVLYSYGLGAAVISNDLERCERVTKVRLIIGHQENN
jgi:hypothetical protein